MKCILTLDNCIKKGQVIVNGYFLFKGAGETVKHILLWCPISYQLWCIVVCGGELSCGCIGQRGDRGMERHLGSSATISN